MAETQSEKLRCVVVTPESTVLDAEADFIAFPAYDGEVGVLPGRAPLVARLGAGELRLTTGQVSRRYFIDGGFGQIRSNVVTLLTARAKPAESLDAAALQKQLDELNTQAPTNDEALDAKQDKVQRTRAQLQIAKK